MPPSRRKYEELMPDEHAALETTRDAMLKITQDMEVAAQEITPSQARYLVDTYYQVQQFRIEATGQRRAAVEANEPVKLLDWVKSITTRLEGTIRAQLDAYTEKQTVSRWAKSIVGIGPVITAGLAAHIDINKAQTAGAIWRFAGLDPSLTWIGSERAKSLVAERWVNTLSPEENLRALAEYRGLRVDSLLKMANRDDGKITKARVVSVMAKRPWNASLKVLCWKIGESFVKVQNREGDVYGHVYAERKAQEIIKNDAGEFAQQAAAILASKNFRDDTLAKAAYLQGKLPDGHIHSRAKRYAVKLFLAHYQHVAFESTFNRLPPKPYIIEHGGHTHFIAPPNWPMQ